MRRSLLARLAGVPWRYARPVTTAAVLVVSLLMALLAWTLLPDAARPALPWVLPVALVGYVVLRLDAHKGTSKRFKHAWVDRLGGDVDDAQTWGLALLVGALLLGAVAAAQHLVS